MKRKNIIVFYTSHRIFHVYIFTKKDIPRQQTTITGLAVRAEGKFYTLGDIFHQQNEAEKGLSVCLEKHHKNVDVG